jgi:hypothetical protein
MESEDWPAGDGIDGEVITEKYRLMGFWIVDVEIVRRLKVVENVANDVVLQEDISNG